VQDVRESGELGWVEELGDLGRAPIAVFGGIYNNHHALRAVLSDAARRGARRLYCLGDLGGFGPSPDKVFPILHEHGVFVVQGNYDLSVGHDLSDCGCGYTDPRDNHFAQLSYAYTLTKTSERNKAFLRTLTPVHEVRLRGKRLRFVHGSPRRVNEFLWESTSPRAFLERLLDEHPCDALLCTHTGLPWERALDSGRKVINVGAIGRPQNDGRLCVPYSLVHVDDEGRVHNERIDVDYDHEALAAEMRAEALPEEFVATIESGYWTTCLEILPAKERSRGKF